MVGLEAGKRGNPLNGNDLSLAHSPIEAGLGIFFNLTKPDFIGSVHEPQGGGFRGEEMKGSFADLPSGSGLGPRQEKRAGGGGGGGGGEERDEERRGDAGFGGQLDGVA